MKAARQFEPEERPTPMLPHGSGTFLKDQSGNGMRQLMETLRECPRCTGAGEIRTSVETDTAYRVTIDTCTLCEGVGCVPKHKIP